VLRVTRQGPEPLQDPPYPGARLEILVADTLVRYWIIDCPPGLASAAELDLYAADRFATIFGDDPSAWVLRVDPVPRAERWLACAIPSLFAVDLPQAAAARGWHVCRVQPRFIREFNEHCRALDTDAAFCVASRESTTIGLIAADKWCGIRIHPPLDRAPASFSTLLRRDCRQAGMSADGLRPVVVGSLRESAR
jgi:hypothetical protein